MDMPEPVRELLEQHYRNAEMAELEPEWHDDMRGFSYNCPTCTERGVEHRADLRMEPMVIIGVATDGSTATGPAG
jgi:hypothetical protein